MKVTILSLCAIRVAKPETLKKTDQLRAAIANVLDVPLHGVPMIPEHNTHKFINNWLTAFKTVDPIKYLNQMPSEGTCIVTTENNVYIFHDFNLYWSGNDIYHTIGEPVEYVMVLDFNMFDILASDQHVSILQFCKVIRESFAHAEFVYTHGSCYKFHEILKAKFEDAIPYYNVDHVISRIGNRFYDVTGEVRGEGFTPLEVEVNSLKFYQGDNKADIADPWFIERLLSTVSLSEVKKWLTRYPKIKIPRVREHFVNIIKAEKK